MKTTGLFTLHRMPLEVQHNKPFHLVPFGDVHRDSDMFCKDYWQRFLDRAKSLKEAVFLGMGDYMDAMSTSERLSLRRGDFHDTTTRNWLGNCNDKLQDLAAELEFMRGRTIGLLGGNHYMEYPDGNTTDHLLAAHLQTKFLGVCSLIRLSLSFKGYNKTCDLDIFAHHGKGGGTTPGAPFNTLEKMQQGADADFYFMGHDHKRGALPSSPRLRLFNGHNNSLYIQERVPWLGRTGSFLKAYEDGKVSYNVDAARAPASLGWIEFEITPYIDTGSGKQRPRFHVRAIS